MKPMELSESAEEILASLWKARETGGGAAVRVADLDLEDCSDAVAELLEAGLAEQHSDVLSMTASGEKEARSIVRRERLAERLLSDVLRVSDEVATETACKFEHLLRRGLDDQICTLLGHPRVCPHGNPIPPGDCCRSGAQTAGRVVSPLAELATGQRGSIAYLQARRPEIIRRLLDMGVVPGVQIELLQSFPSYVFQVGESQVAVDRETAQDVYVRMGANRPAAHARSWLPRGLRHFRRRRGRRWR
jgi:DtxR family Mn-dependent transcriptional regulator